MTSQLATSGPSSYNLQRGGGGGGDLKTSYLVCVCGGGYLKPYLVGVGI